MNWVNWMNELGALGELEESEELDELVGKVLHLLNGSVQVLSCQGGGQVGRVGGDHDQGEQVPHP